MKILKAKDSKGYFQTKDGNEETIDKLDKDDLLRLANIVLSDADVVIEEFDPDTIKNQAHQVIYKSVSQKLLELQSSRSTFLDSSQSLFQKEYDAYKAKSTDEESSPKCADLNL